SERRLSQLLARKLERLVQQSRIPRQPDGDLHELFRRRRDAAIRNARRGAGRIQDRARPRGADVPTDRASEYFERSVEDSGEEVAGNETALVHGRRVGCDVWFTAGPVPGLRTSRRELVRNFGKTDFSRPAEL